MNKEVSPGFFGRLMTWGGLWRDIADKVSGADDLDNLNPDLPEDDARKIRAGMDDCLASRGGEVSARARAATLGRAYLSLNDQGRARFLEMLAREYATDHDRVRDTAAALMSVDSEDFTALQAAEGQMRDALVPPRLRLLKQFNALPRGIKFLVDMRAELKRLARENPALRGLERDMRDLLASWFDIGFLELQRITWNSPAAFLEKIITYEAVHEIRSWADLKDRLDHDRRLYAFVHPNMPEEPLIFVEVALVHGIAGNVHDLLDMSAPALDPEDADTAIFYSISNAQEGLAGISFGNFLIKQVVERLSHSFPKVTTFSTLSPIPGFRTWLDHRLAEGEPGLLLPAERKVLTQLSETGGDEGDSTGTPSGTKGQFKALIADPEWPNHEPVANALKTPLTRLCARYLVNERRPPRVEGRPATVLDPVAHFHLTNGARVERLNWLGNRSSKGLAQSAGLMVNYLYKLNEIEKNHEAYQGQGKVPTSTAIRSLART
ncbi:malonyl-CoA decarboxylase [Roseospira marina]|uniref:Malonyl-CoA decarboxylase n=1 Tax=Roseospira marina TaxID=140057 RepID=A0A5M6IGN1_9PROT|nr:malonyl-CoA decarboxylase [Roseospira marina]KAA5606738.1 malonyl-CoA decarboxylase [Roseospira marina]MBB4313842.1 malonyl-CoA decarboxylase [Roseospira marina]MBB5087004.1 malonyl-CoA decarboxylase [Roseospira marina]